MQGGFEVRAHPERHRYTGDDEPTECSRHGGQCPADEHASRDAERECKGGIADGHDASLVEHRRESVHVDPVDWARPPRHHEAEEPGDGDAGEADQTELDCDPASARDTLRPRQAVRAGFQLASHEWRAPKDPDDRGEGDDDVAEILQQAIFGEERGGRRGAVAMPAACRDCCVVEVGEVRPGETQYHGNDCQRAEGNRSLHAELERSEPDHRITLNPLWVTRSLSRAWPM